MKILHINDLHINDPDDGSRDALRKAFYPEYLETLIEKLEKRQEKIDIIIITGDIVNKAKTENYTHAKELIHYFAGKISVSKKNVYISNGNHDIDKDTGELADFKEFASNFSDDIQLLEVGDRFKYYGLNTTEGLICLDSIGSEYKTGKPSPLPDKVKDKIVTLTREKTFKTVFVLSHHPPHSYDVQNQAPFDEGDPNWSADHIWHDGGALFRRLSSGATASGCVFWFAGDIHRPEHCVINGNGILVITGSLNANEKSKSHILPQIRIVSTDNIHHSHLYEYQFVGHNRKGLVGRWERRDVQAHSFDTVSSQLVNNKAIERSKITLKSKDATSEKPKHSINERLKLLDSDLDQRIYNKVIEKKLYEFGRFETNFEMTSLSWVSTSHLLQNYPIFIRVLNVFKASISSLIPSHFNLNDCLLVGVDLWGSILASRLGAATNIRSCCVAVRSHSDYYDSVERVNDKLKKIVKEKKISFVISDVISTGRSVAKIRAELDCSECANWYNLAILCDPRQERGDCLKGYKETLYACGSVRMPIIERHKLPEINMLRANLSFIKPTM